MVRGTGTNFTLKWLKRSFTGFEVFRTAAKLGFVGNLWEDEGYLGVRVNGRYVKVRSGGTFPQWTCCAGVCGCAGQTQVVHALEVQTELEGGPKALPTRRAMPAVTNLGSERCR